MRPERRPTSGDLLKFLQAPVGAGRFLLAFVLLPLLLLGGGLARAGCWAPHDRDLWSDDELDGRVTLSFRNAINCVPVADAEVSVGEHDFRTDRSGLIRLPAGIRPENGDLALLVSAEGYQPTRFDLQFIAGLPRQNRLPLSPRLAAGQARFVLSWGSADHDFDLFVVGEGQYWSTHDLAPDTAAAEGHGPDTLTLSALQPDGRYTVWVHRAAGAAEAGPAAQVHLYFADGASRGVLLPVASAPWVEVAEIERGNVRLILRPSGRGP